MTKSVRFGCHSTDALVGDENFLLLAGVLPGYLEEDGSGWQLQAPESSAETELAIRLLHSWGRILENAPRRNWVPCCDSKDEIKTTIHGFLEFGIDDLGIAELLSFSPALKFGEMYPYQYDGDYKQEAGVEMGWMEWGGSPWCATGEAADKLAAWKRASLELADPCSDLSITETRMAGHPVWVVDVHTVLPPTVIPTFQDPRATSPPGYEVYTCSGWGQSLAYRRKDLDVMKHRHFLVAASWEFFGGTRPWHRHFVCRRPFYEWAVAEGFQFKWTPVELLEAGQESQFIKPPCADLIAHLQSAPAEQLMVELDAMLAGWPRHPSPEALIESRVGAARRQKEQQAAAEKARWAVPHHEDSSAVIAAREAGATPEAIRQLQLQEILAELRRTALTRNDDDES